MEVNGIHLEKCPFCGSDAHEGVVKFGGRVEFYIECSQNRGWCAVIPRTWSYDTLEDAVDAWNERHG